MYLRKAGSAGYSELMGLSSLRLKVQTQFDALTLPTLLRTEPPVCL